MTYLITTPRLGTQPIAATETVQAHPLGTIVKAVDPIYGEGEFVYLKGVASTAAGDVVLFDQYAGTTTRGVANARGPASVAMSANVANQYGWYQLAGAAVTKAGTVAAGGDVYLTATAGQVDDAAVSGDKIDGMRFKTANGTPAAGQAICQLDRPSANGNG